jgi:23S rRNA (cytidine1920-2'-O)/16S rRNA (cytidine1409-2'-O)-methyltransferase
VEGPARRFVSRGGEKLDAALARFGVSATGKRALDAGASTGGFTDCLLQHGAVLVFAVDVGHGQIDARLRSDERVVVLERTNVRDLTPVLLAEADPRWSPVDVVTADLSFISLTLVAPVLVGPVARSGSDLLGLVKPQFEAGRAEVSRGRGVVRDPAIWRRALGDAASALVDARAAIMGAMPSPLIGPAGNVEFLLHAVVGSGVRGDEAVNALLDSAVDEAVARNATAGAPVDGD